MPPAAAASGSADGCPVDHSKFTRAAAAASPLLAPPSKAPLVCDSSSLDMPAHGLPSMTGTCPVDHSKFTAGGAAGAGAVAPHSVVGDVFPDATPSATQRGALSTTPVASRIPKGGVDPTAGTPLADDATWVFPSPQRFFNAMQKKGWDPREPDMAWVVSIHNTVNEQSWARVMEYERMHADSCPRPKLLRFRGRPADLSPKARMLSWFGYVTPFDRHDWVVDRCGKEVRYVIDFYSGAGDDMTNALPGMPPSIHLDVRPALTPMGAVDRIRMQLSKWFPGSK